MGARSAAAGQAADGAAGIAAASTGRLQHREHAAEPVFDAVEPRMHWPQALPLQLLCRPVQCCCQTPLLPRHGRRRHGRRWRRWREDECDGRQVRWGRWRLRRRGRGRRQSGLTPCSSRLGLDAPLLNSHRPQRIPPDFFPSVAASGAAALRLDLSLLHHLRRPTLCLHDISERWWWWSLQMCRRRCRGRLQVRLQILLLKRQLEVLLLLLLLLPPLLLQVLSRSTAESGTERRTSSISGRVGPRRQHT
mmetsp:Transcript_61557/g.176567  ORF Transcript_61557/g.176567 Transcript_61557/m.176567 type:complete len:249 (+) Transcript_61557:588-1334(+)